MEKVIYRKTTIDDAYAIEYVGAHSWNESYQNFMPKEYLENRINTIENKINRAKELLSKTNTYYVAEVDGNVIGIVYFKESQSKEFKEHGYLDSLYVLKKFQGKGIGKQLFKIAIEGIIKLGYNNMYLECIKENSTIDFYKKYRGKIVDTIDFPIRNFTVEASVIEFNDLKKIKEDILNYNN